MNLADSQVEFDNEGVASKGEARIDGGIDISSSAIGEPSSSEWS
jgi:hypothetical protein